MISKDLASVVYKFFDEKFVSNTRWENLPPWAMRDKSASDGAVKNEISSNKELAKELHKTVIIKFEKRKIGSTFIDDV